MKKELLKVKKEQIAKKDCDWRLVTNIVSIDIVVYFCDFSLNRVWSLSNLKTILNYTVKSDSKKKSSDKL